LGFYFLLLMILINHSTLAVEDEINSPVAERAPAWVKSGPRGTAGTNRVAVLIGVASSSTLPSRNLPHVWKNLTSIETALSELGGGFDIKTFKESAAVKDSIASYLTEILPTRFTGEDNLLLIYYSGYGVYQNGLRSYFTWSTSRNEDLFEELITEKEICSWIKTLKEKSNVKVAFIVEAVAFNNNRPPVDFSGESIGDLCLYSTPINTMAKRPSTSHSSVFTEALCSTMKSLSSEPRIELLDLFAQTTKELDSSREANGPQCYAWKKSSIVLKDNNNLGVRVKVIDGVSDNELVNASVRRGDEVKEMSPCLFTGLKAGRYSLSIEAEGYQKRSAELCLTTENTGLIFEVPLYPNYSVVKGRVQIQPENKATLEGLIVETKGVLKEYVSGFHNHTSRVDPDSGLFTLIIPAKTKELKLNILEGTTVISDAEIDLETAVSIDNVRNGNRFSVFTVEPIRLDSKANPNSTGIVSLAGDARWLFSEAEKLLIEGRTSDLDSAIVYYRETLRWVKDAKTTGFINSRICKAYERLFRYYLSRGLYGKGVSLSKAAVSLYPDNRSFDTWKDLFEKEHIPLTTRRSLEEAGKAVDEGDYSRAEGILAEVLNNDKLTIYYQERIASNLEEVKNALFRENFSRMNNMLIKERFEESVPYFIECRRLRPRNPILELWEEKLVVYVDEAPPDIQLLSPRQSTETVNKETFTLSGIVTDNLGVGQFSVNGSPVELNGEDPKVKAFSLDVKLTKGENWFILSAHDKKKQKTVLAVAVNYSVSPLVNGFTYLRTETFCSGNVTNSMMIYSHDLTGLEFVYIPGGDYMRGSLTNEAGRAPNESPRRKVVIKPYLLCRTECTQRAWDVLRGEDERYWCAQELPIDSVTWDQCVKWCEGANLRLPSEAEWEYACRGGVSTPYSFGEDLSDLGIHAWFNHNSNGKVHITGQKNPNAFGLYDIHGNMMEWCQDRWHDSYFEAPDNATPWEIGASNARVARGGSWYNSSIRCRSAYRHCLKPCKSSLNVGFRPAKSID